MTARRASSRSHDLVRQLSATGQQLNHTSADFLKVDVETALTFTGLALETDSQEKKKRNRQNARKAYDTILRLSDNVVFTPSQKAYMRKKISRLKNNLQQLGEKF